MIKLYGFGRAFGLADPSPFVVKAEVLLKLAGLPYERASANIRKAPKGKAPYIDDNGTIVADSTFIRMHMERTRGIDFDKGLSDEQKGVAWAVEKMLEDHLYWLVVHERWMIPDNFDRGPRKFFDSVPAPLRPFILAMVRRKVAANLHAQGTGRHTDQERVLLAARAATALARIIGDKPWLMGETPCGADATAYAFVSGSLCPLFEGPTRTAVTAHANLVAYAQRGRARWFAELAEDA